MHFFYRTVSARLGAIVALTTKIKATRTVLYAATDTSQPVPTNRSQAGKMDGTLRVQLKAERQP